MAGRRTGTDWFAPADLAQLFQGLRLPTPANVSQHLARLRSANLVVRNSKGRSWALTPLGEQRVVSLLGKLDYAQISIELAGSPGAQFAHAQHPVIDPSFAPPRWAQGILRLLDSYPFESNVFCMTRFPSSDNDTEFLDPVRDVVATMRNVMSIHGLTLHLASDRQIEDDLLGNVGAYMWACQYGIGLLENRLDRGLNYNVVIELGAMLMTGRRCALFKDHTAPSLPTDLAGQIYKSVDFDDLGQIANETHRWIAEDLAIGRCDECP